MKKEWYKSWFDTEYYHSLYNHRDSQEAQNFLNSLMEKLQLPLDKVILDAPCGRGRHAIYLNSLGYQVDALDLSKSNIEYAKNYEKENLHFYVASIEEVFKAEHYDLIVNLFTSFGYWEEESKNQEVFQKLTENLKENGVMVVDFMNAHNVRKKLNTDKEFIKRESVEYEIQRRIENDMVKKHIKFYDYNNAEQGDYTEAVKLLELEDFKKFGESAGMTLLEYFGDYDLNPYEADNSPRLIMIFSK